MARVERDFDLLSRGARRRWIAAYGGPWSLAPQRRAERARRAYEVGEHLPVERTGHAGPYEASYSQVVTTKGAREVTVHSRVEARRVGDHAHDVRLLQDGKLDPRAFRRRWRRRVRKVADYELDWDPDRVIAAVTEAGPPPEPFYRHRPARRTR
jgi:hypothetical protein